MPTDLAKVLLHYVANALICFTELESCIPLLFNIVCLECLVFKSAVPDNFHVMALIVTVSLSTKKSIGYAEIIFSSGIAKQCL